METLITVLKTALPVFLALFLGMLCREKKLLTQEGVDALKKTVLNITLPAVVFGAFATAEYSVSSITVPLTMFLLCCAGLLLGRLGTKLLHLGGKLTPFLCAGFEAGMLGYALFVLLYPEAGTSRFALVDLGQSLFVFTVYKALLTGKGSRKALLRDALTSPILWAIFAGVLVGATGLWQTLTNAGAASVVTALTDFVAAPTGMMILLAVGYDLRLREIHWKETAGQVVLRLGTAAILLAALLLLNRTLLRGAVHEGAAVLMFLLPPPFVLPIFANEPRERTQIASTLSALTAVSMALFAVMAVVVSL